MYEMRLLVVISVLLVLSIQDIKWKYIDIRYLFIGIPFLLIRICAEQKFYQIIISLLPGIVILIISFILKEIGSGDAYVLMFIGAVYDSNTVIGTMYFSFLFAGLFAVYKLTIKKAKRTNTIAYVPFIFIGFIVTEIIFKNL